MRFNNTSQRLFNQVISGIITLGYLFTAPLADAYVLCLSEHRPAQLELACQRCCLPETAGHEQANRSDGHHSATVPHVHIAPSDNCEDVAIGELLVSETGRTDTGKILPPPNYLTALAAAIFFDSQPANTPCPIPIRAPFPTYPSFLRTIILLL